MSRYQGRHAPRHAAPKPTGATRVAGALRRPAVSGSLVLAVVGTGAAGFQAGDGHQTAAASFSISTEAVAQANELSDTTIEDTARLTAARNGAIAVQATRDGQAQAQARVQAAALVAARKAAADRAAREAQRTALIANAKTNPKGAAMSLMGDFGFNSGQWGCLEQLWTGESGWNYKAWNSGSGAGGIPQALPASKMATAGADWQSNPVTQITWGLGYIKNVYGSPCNAWGQWQSRYPHWY
ncbi:MAG: hypothetical protein ABI131_10295 [Nostocoides sp.]